MTYRELITILEKYPEATQHQTVTIRVGDGEYFAAKLSKVYDSDVLDEGHLILEVLKAPT